VAAVTYSNYIYRLPFDISPVVVSSFLVARFYGILPAAAMIAIAGIAPMMIAGGLFDHTTIFYVGVNLIFCFICTKTVFLPLIFIYLLVIANHLVSLVGGIYLGTSPMKEIINLIIKLVLDGSYYFVLEKAIGYLL
jgi:hypothetical protein